jgi:hypothetical protein
VQNLIDQTDEILLPFYEHHKSSKSTLAWANDLVKSRYVESVQELAKKENGWHFGTLQASAKKLQEFWIEDMAQKMEDLAPELWDLLGLMLFANIIDKNMDDVHRSHWRWRVVYPCFLPAALERLKGKGGHVIYVTQIGLSQNN